MSVNKFMHPRNIYKSPPNFKQLALEFPEFKEYVKLDITGKVTFDFKNPKALRALSTVLLKKDYGLEVDIPLNKLIPTIPLRLNYILWIEDLMKFIAREDNIKGIDIGTGASCVYPLMAARKNNWKMLATEVDSASFACAEQNVTKNSLQNLIQISKISTDKLLVDVISGEEEYDFCMCNPPFFSSTQELHPFFKSRKASRPHPKNAFVASVNEVVANGGEVEFITKLINESKQLGLKIKIYTTMVGHKSNLNELKKNLREVKVQSFHEGEFCQGNTTRWGLAWTFYENFDLKKFTDPVKMLAKPKKLHNPLEYVLPLTEVSESKLELIITQILTLFKNLQMTCEKVSRVKNIHRYFITAHSNTWSHQRQKRREKLKKTSESMEQAETNSLEGDNNNIIDKEVKSPGKRLPEDNFDGSMIKRLKIDKCNITASGTYYFKFLFTVKLLNDQIVLELNTVDRDSNREYLHQILQYLKNNFKVDNTLEI